MKKIFLVTLLCLLSSLLFSQTTRIPRTVTKTRATVLNKVGEGILGVRYNVTNGYVSVKYEMNGKAVDNIVTKSTPLNSAMCLTREEVKGQKIESELVIADPKKATQILPGAVIDGSKLLNTGEFVYVKMDKRKPVTLSTTTNMAKLTMATVTPSGNENIEAKIRSRLQTLTRASNMTGTPSEYSDATMKTSTSKENTGLKIGASFFYMGVSAEDNFSFSSEKYRYMYLFEYEQVCIPVLANAISSPSDVFTDNSPAADNHYYIREVKYGRRLYVLVESQTDQESYFNKFTGGVDWGVVGAEYSQENRESFFASTTNIRVLAQGGQPVALTDITKLKETMDKYFAAPLKDINIVPLSYKLTSLTGTPVSMLTNAFLNGNNCLDAKKVRIRIKNIKCEVADDGDYTEQVYGAVTVLLYDAAGKVVAADGKKVLPNPGTQVPTGFIRYAPESAPLVIRAGGLKEFTSDQQDKYIDVSISNLDMTIEVKPAMKEKDEISDDVFVTDNKLKKTIRKMLMEGSTTTTFEFRHDKSVMKMTIEITPLY
jgi:hypothetical protein